MDSTITDYSPHLSHADYTTQLRADHARKASFWDRVG